MRIKCASLCKAGRSGHPPLPIRALLGVTTENNSRDLKGLTRGGVVGTGVLPRPALPLNFWETVPLLQAVYCPLLEVLGAMRLSKVGALGVWTSYTAKHSVSGGEERQAKQELAIISRQNAGLWIRSLTTLDFPCTRIQGHEE